jgi:hypothetical protein
MKNYGIQLKFSTNGGETLGSKFQYQLLLGRNFLHKKMPKDYRTFLLSLNRHNHFLTLFAKQVENLPILACRNVGGRGGGPISTVN